VDQVNQRLAAVATTLLTHAPRDDWARSWQIPLDAISTRTEPRIVRPKDIRKTLSEGALTPNDYLRVIDAVLTGELSVRTKESPTVAVQPEDLASPRLSLVREALDRIKQDLPRLVQNAQPTDGIETLFPIDSATETAIRDWARRPFQAAAESLFRVRVSDDTGGGNTTAPRNPLEDRHKLLLAELKDQPLHVLASVLAGEANYVLQHELIEVLQAELGELWFFGRYKWCEIAFWTIFGVLIMALAELGFASARGRRMRDGSLWQPRETLRVVGRMAYAPFLTIGFLWLAIATPLLEGYEFLATSTFGVLAFAFLVGFVPNTLLDRLQRTLFALLGREDKVRGANASNLPKTSVVTRHVPVAEVPSIDELRAKLTEISMAPLR
jgi:hypothetical protein